MDFPRVCALRVENTCINIDVIIVYLRTLLFLPTEHAYHRQKICIQTKKPEAASHIRFFDVSSSLTIPTSKPLFTSNAKTKNQFTSVEQFLRPPNDIHFVSYQHTRSEDTLKRHTTSFSSLALITP